MTSIVKTVVSYAPIQNNWDLTEKLSLLKGLHIALSSTSLLTAFPYSVKKKALTMSNSSRADFLRNMELMKAETAEAFLESSNLLPMLCFLS